MSSISTESFVNGVMAGAGAVLALMSLALVQAIAPLETELNISSTEVRLAILLGALVCVISIGYEFYRKKKTKKQKDKSADTEIDEAKYRKLYDKFKKEEQKAESSDQ